MYNDKRIIISMTSWPKRIDNVSKVIYSIYKNTIKPDKIELNLSYEEFVNRENDLPDDLLALVNNEIVTINWVKENTGVFKKFIPVLQKYIGEDYYLLSIDDDWIYNENYIKTMLKRIGDSDYFSLVNPNHVIGNSTIYRSKCFKHDFWELITKKLIEIGISDYYITCYLKKYKCIQKSGKHEPLYNFATLYNPVCPNSKNKTNGNGAYDPRRVDLAHKETERILFK